MDIKKIKEYWRNKVDGGFVEFIECLENDLKPFARLIDYNYKFSNGINYHNYTFEIIKELSDEEIKKIQSLINTFDEGSVTCGVLHLGCIYVTIFNDS